MSWLLVIGCVLGGLIGGIVVTVILINLATRIAIGRGLGW